MPKRSMGQLIRDQRDAELGLLRIALEEPSDKQLVTYNNALCEAARRYREATKARRDAQKE